MRIFLERITLTLVNMFRKHTLRPGAPLFSSPPQTTSPSTSSTQANPPPSVPPLSVMLVAGVGMDALVNTLWFLCGVIPGHVHGFYVTWTYFSRKKKVRKGRYPGGPKPFIYSRRVINGDASDQHVRELWRAEQRAAAGEGQGQGQGGGGTMPKRSSRRASGRRASRRYEV